MTPHQDERRRADGICNRSQGLEQGREQGREQISEGKVKQAFGVSMHPACGGCCGVDRSATEEAPVFEESQLR